MPAERFFIPSPSLNVKDLIPLEKEEFHHLIHVMRAKVGDTVELINGLGCLAQATLQSIQKHTALLHIDSVYQEEKPSYQLILAQALPRLPKLEWILEKGTELGVTDFWLFPGGLSEKKEFSHNQLERIEHIIVSALKQCGRLFLPRLVFKPSLFDWTSKEIPSHAFFGDTRAEAPLFLPSLLSLSSQSCLIAIGPEKGFNDKETQCMEKTLHFNGVHLHQNILRTETAAIYSLSLASAFLFK